jgi:hypothetical protein
MRYLLFLFLVAFAACKNSGNDKKHISPSDSAVIKQGPLTEEDANADSTSPSPSVYYAYLPAGLSSHVNALLPDWTLPDQSNWDKYWWYKKDKSLVSYVSGDFNCDNKTDHALILTKKNGDYAAWAFLAKDSSFQDVKLEEISREGGPIGIGIEILEKGKHGDLDNDKAKPVDVACEGVTIIFFEKAAHSFYWEKGKVKRIQTGD